jgi:hypothetical protein
MTVLTALPLIVLMTSFRTKLVFSSEIGPGFDFDVLKFSLLSEVRSFVSHLT